MIRSFWHVDIYISHRFFHLVYISLIDFSYAKIQINKVFEAIIIISASKSLVKCYPYVFTGKFILLRILRHAPTRRALLVGCGLQMFQQLAAINTVMYVGNSTIAIIVPNNKSLSRVNSHELARSVFIHVPCTLFIHLSILYVYSRSSNSRSVRFQSLIVLHPH